MNSTAYPPGVAAAAHRMLARVRPLEIALQLAALYVVIAAALRFESALTVLPQALARDVNLNAADIQRIYTYLLAVHAGAYLLSRVFQHKPLLGDARRALVEAYFAMAANGLAIGALFLLTPTPFDPNLYAMIYFGLALVYLLAIGWAARIEHAWREAVPAIRAVVLSRWTPLALLAAMAPGILAAASFDRDIENFFNRLRVQASVRTSADWMLVQAFERQRFEQPIYLQPDPRERDALLVLGRTGRLHAFSGGTSTLLLDLWPEVRSVDAELGAFSFALHPEFGQPGSPNRGFAYVWYSAREDDVLELRLTRFDIGADTLETRQTSRLPLIAVERPPSGIHNGGTVLFGADGFLYLSIGDFFDYRNAQGADKTLAGGIIRIDVDQRGGAISTPIARSPADGFTGNYSIPTDNPWHGRRGVFEEFWAIGLRNPFRMSMNADGTLWVGDVGWHAWEEHNIVAGGDNGGWPFREGPDTTMYAPPDAILGRLIEPAYAYPHTSVAAAALGGFVYRGARYPELKGLYLFADNNDGTVMAFDPDVGTPYDRDVRVLARANQFGEMGLTGIYPLPDGRILLTSLGSKQRPDGELLELVPAAARPTDAAAEPGPSSGTSEASTTHDGTGAAAARPAGAALDDPYAALCSRCHGLDGRGQPELGAAAATKPRPDFTSETWQDSITDARIKAVIVAGGKGLGLSEEMPAFGTFFSEDELARLIERVRAFDRPRTLEP